MAKKFRDTSMDPDRRTADSRNRAEKKRDAHEARMWKMADQLSDARPDGRPQYYMIPPEETVTNACYVCAGRGLGPRLYKYGELMMNDPANPPKGARKGEIHKICRGHLPDNAVIFDPKTGRSQTKTGEDMGVESWG